MRWAVQSSEKTSRSAWRIGNIMGTEGTANNIVVYTQVKKADTLYKLVTSSMAENKAIGQQVLLLLLLFLFSSTKFP